MDTQRLPLTALALALLLPLVACGGGGGGGDPVADDPILPPPVNLPPRVALPLSSINATAGDGTSVHNVNAAAFVDPEGDPLVVVADLPDGSPLPSWVTFDASALQLTWDKDVAPIGTRTIRIRATDAAGGSAQFLTALNLSGGPLPSGRTLISRPDGPGQANGESDEASISGLGTYVAFATEADNLHPAQASPLDILVRHVGEGTLELANSNASGIGGSRGAFDATISFDGRRVAFVDGTPWFGSLLDNYVDVFLKDLDTGALTQVSSVPSGEPDSNSLAPSVSAEGDLVAFNSQTGLLVADDANSEHDVFVRDLSSEETTRESVLPGPVEGSDASLYSSLSADGRFIAFETRAGELAGLTGTMTRQIVVRDRLTGAVEIVSVNAAGELANWGCYDSSLSADGRFVSFTSQATNLDPSDTDDVIDIYVHDRWTDETRRVSHDEEGLALPGVSFFGSSSSSLSADGRYIAFRTSGTPVSDDDNNVDDVYVLDRYGTRYRFMTARTVSGVPSGSARQPSLSANASAVACSVASDDMSATDTNGFEDVWWIPTRVRGGTLRDDHLQGGFEDDWLRGLSGHDKISGSDGDDLIEPGPGFDELRGGGGIDTYVWWRTDEGLDHIVDFQTGFLGDRLDLRRLLPAGAAASPADHVRFTDDGHNVTVAVDADGPGGSAPFAPIVVLEGVAPLTLADALDDDQLLLP